MLAIFIAHGLLARPPCSFLVIGALLCGCSESAVVIAQTRLHKAPTAESQVVALVPKGSKVYASGCNYGWCWIKWNRQQGYALAKLLRTRSSGPGPAVEDRDDYGEAGQDAAGDDD
jgi:hypothetical protein